jgi:hypothetical protein
MSALPNECNSIRERLPEYADDALTGRELAQVEQHVASCERCRQEVADLRVVIGAVRAIPPDEVPDTLVPRLRRAIQERAPAPGLRLLWPRLAVPVAILACVIALTVALRLPRHQMESAGRVAFAPAPSAATEIAQKPAEPGVSGSLPGGARLGVAARVGEAQQPAATTAEPEPAQAAPGAVEEFAAPQAADQTATKERSETQNAAEPPAQHLAQSSQAGYEKASGTMKGADRDLARRPSVALPPAPAGAMRGGGGRAGGGRPSGPPGPAYRQGPYDWRGRRGPYRGEARESASALSAAGAKAEVSTVPPALARAALMQGAEGKLIALNIEGGEVSDTITVRLGSGPPQSYQWRGAGTRSPMIPLPTTSLGPGPAAVPVEVKSSAGEQSYMLFLPTMARLGQVAPAAPVARYAGAPLSSVLADLSKTTGLVILAEQPLDRDITGPIPQGTPAASLRALCAATGFDVQSEDDLVFTLTRRR